MPLGSTSITYQHHLEAPLLQHPEQRYPVHAGGLHDHGVHAALLQPVGQAVQVRREDGKLSHRLLHPVGGNCREVAGGPHVNARRVQVKLGQPLRFCVTLASVHHRLHRCRVGVSPEGATDRCHSPQRDRPDRGVANDAVVRLPDHVLRVGQYAPVSARSSSGRHASPRAYILGPTHRLVASAQAGHGHNFATDWPRRALATTATPASGAITRCWPSPLAPATC